MDHCFGPLLGLEPFMVPHAAHPLTRRLLMAKTTGQRRLHARLFINNDRHIGRDRFDLTDLPTANLPK